jgi:hypothetical protein
MLRPFGFNERFRVRDRLEAELTRDRGRVAGLNANVEAFPDSILLDAVSGASGRYIGFPILQHLHDVGDIPKPRVDDFFIETQFRPC